MAIALVSNVAKANATSSSTTAIDTTGATLLVANITDYSGQAASVLTDSKGNTWTELTRRTQGTIAQRILYVASPTVGTNHTFSIDGTNSFVVVCVAAFSGVATSSPKDQDAGAIGTASTIQPGSITPTEDNELIVAGIGTSAGSSTIDSGFAETDDSLYAGFFSAMLAYLVQTSAAAVNPIFTIGAGNDNACSQASFKAAAGAGSKVPVMQNSYRRRRGV